MNDQELYDKWIEAVKEDDYLDGYGEIASTIIFFGLEGVEEMTEEEYRDGA